MTIKQIKLVKHLKIIHRLKKERKKNVKSLKQNPDKMQSTKIRRQDAIFLLHKNTTKNHGVKKKRREIYALLLLPDAEVKIDTVKSRDRECFHEIGLVLSAMSWSISDIALNLNIPCTYNRSYYLMGNT